MTLSRLSRWFTDKISLHLYKNNNFFPEYFNITDSNLSCDILYLFSLRNNDER